MFAIDKHTAQAVMYPAPDVVPEILFAIDEVPSKEWNAAGTLEELAEVMTPHLDRAGARPWDFLWSMERHFCEPYGPLRPATQTTMAGIPEMFLPKASASTASHAPTAATGRGTLDEQAHLNRVDQRGVTVLADPYQFDSGSEMPDEYREWLRKLMFAHGECMDPSFGEGGERAKSFDIFEAVDSWALANAPDAESRLRISNFKAEEYKHTYQFYKVYQAFEEGLPEKIFQRDVEVFRAYTAVVIESTWLDHAVNNLLSDRFGVYQCFEWVRSSYAPLAQVSLKVVKDERGHSNMGYVHVRRELERAGEEARKHAQQRIDDYWYPYFMAAFGSDESKNNLAWRRWGLKQHGNAELRAAYHREVSELLPTLGLEAPDMHVALQRGRRLVAEEAARHKK